MELKASRTAQWPLVAEFVFNFDDTMKDVNGVTKDFGATNVAATSFAAIPLPPNAVVTGGGVTTETAFDAATYNVTVGDASVANRYLASTDKKSLGHTALVPTGYVSDGGNLVIGVTPADACTTGKMAVRVEYVIRGRSNEVQIQ